MTENIYWTIRATVVEGKLEDLKAIVEKTSAATRTEAGALSYDFWLSEDNKRLFLHERYTNSEAVLAHMANVGPLLPDFFACVEMEPIVVLGACSDALKEAFAAFGVLHVTFLAGL